MGNAGGARLRDHACARGEACGAGVGLSGKRAVGDGHERRMGSEARRDEDLLQLHQRQRAVGRRGEEQGQRGQPTEHTEQHNPPVPDELCKRGERWEEAEVRVGPHLRQGASRLSLWRVRRRRAGLGGSTG